MKTPLLRRDADALAIDENTLHQYYNTVQSDVHPQHLVDAAMSRRQAMALQAQRRQGSHGRLVVVALVLLAACAVWLFA